MKRFAFILLIWLLATSHSNAQLLSTQPAFPAENGALVITVDCTYGNQGLQNYANTGDVYVHIGVITNLSLSPSDWKHTKFTWGTTDPAAKASYIGNNRYQYSISNLSNFFALSAGETILRVAVLFRNGNGSLAQRNADLTDMYIPVYGTALAGRYFQPFLQPKYNPVPEPIQKNVGDSIKIVYKVNSTVNSLSLYFNGSLINTAASDTIIADSPKIITAGNQQVVVKAESGGNTLSDTINFFVASAPTVAVLPNGVRDGINYEPGDTSAILVLYAPNKSRVSVIGEFNDWLENTSYLMNRTPDGNRYWLRLTGLAPGYEYAYQYLVNGNLRIADPYTEKILDPSNDPNIPYNTYPNIKAYPAGKTTGIVGTLRTAAPAYSWQATSFSKPDKRNLVIYELLLRDFLAAHDWKTIRDTLSYFKGLGINAIELMPVNEFEGNLGWGYNPSFYFTPDKSYGPSADMKAFVDACHQQGIAVIMDIALNHSFGQSPMVQLYFDAANNRPAADNPWFNPVPKHAFNVGYDMNHESPATRYFVSRVVEYWLQQFRIDGFRFDLSKGFTQKATCDANGGNCDVGGWSAYDASRVAIWKAYYDTVQSKANGSYVILEHFADNSEEKELSAYGMMLWGNGNGAFNEATMGYLGGSDFEGVLHTARGWSEPHLVGYMESHDEERLMYKNINYGNASGSYNIKDINTGLRRNEMAAAFLFMMPGPKMIWEFGELGYDFSINYCQNGTINTNCRLDAKPIRWDYRQNSARRHLHDAYAAMLQLRAHPLFSSGFLTNRVDFSLAGAVKWLKLTTDTSNIFVIGNFDVTPNTGTVTFQNAGTWYDYLGGQTLNAIGTAQTISLQPGEYHIYLNRNVTNVLTPVTEIVYNGKKIRLSSWPNPVLNPLQVEFEVPEAGKVRLSILDISGRLLSVPFDGFVNAGVHQVNMAALNGRQKLAPSVYLLQMDYGNRRLVQKLIVK